MSGLLLLRRRLCTGCLSSRLVQVRRYGLIGKPNQTSRPTWALPESPARTRFAPSPTGYLHLGSLRTALYNYLLAQATGGQFIIRLEDTDQTRFVEDAEDRLYQDLQWAGLSWDEGPDMGGPFGPYKQSERLGLYRQHADTLLESGHAFRCFCTKEDLEFHLKQATAAGATAHYPGTCLGISQSESDRRAADGEAHTIRFKTAETPVSAPDLVYGAYKKAEREDNFIIMKTDGFPTYHFANVVDDHYMKITHVIRGAEWLISTPKHVELYNAFGWQPPNFAHVGLLVDVQRQKLSKRDIENIGIFNYRNSNILPEALLNYSASLGWDPSLKNNTHLDKRGVMTLDEMRKNFTLKFTRGDIVVDMCKLKFFQAKFIRGIVSGDMPNPSSLTSHILKPILCELQRLSEGHSKFLISKISVDEEDREIYSKIARREPVEPTEEYVHNVLKAWKGPVDDVVKFIHDNLYAFWSPTKAAYKDTFLELQESVARVQMTKGNRKIVNTDISKVLVYFRNKLLSLQPDQWNAETVGIMVKELVDSIEYYDTKKEQLVEHSAGWKFLRWSLLNGMPGQSIVPMMLLLGPEESLKRMREARKVAAAMEKMIDRGHKQGKRDWNGQAIRIKHLGNPLDEDPEELERKFKSFKAPEPRKYSLYISKGLKPKPTTEPLAGHGNFLRPVHEPRPEHGPFVSRPPHPLQEGWEDDMEDKSRPAQFLKPEEHKTGFRRLNVKGDDDRYAPASWEMLQKRGDRLEPTPTGRVESTTQQETAKDQGWFSPTTPPQPGARLRPVHPKGWFFVGEPVVDYSDHVKHLRDLNNKRYSREHRKPVSAGGVGPFRAGDPVGYLYKELSGEKGPLYVGKPVSHPRDSVQRSATALGDAVAVEDDQVGREVDREEHLSRHLHTMDAEFQVRTQIDEGDGAAMADLEAELGKS